MLKHTSRFRKQIAVLLAGVMLLPSACGQSAPELRRTTGTGGEGGFNALSQADTPLAQSSTQANRQAPRTTGPQTRAPNSGSLANNSTNRSGQMAEPKGLVDNRRLFDTPISDPITRIRRIELAVQDLRDDFDTAIPAMAGLVVSEAELAQVIEDLKRSGEIRYTDITPPKSSKLPRNPLEPSISRTVTKTTAKPVPNKPIIEKTAPTETRVATAPPISAGTEADKMAPKDPAPSTITKAEPPKPQKTKEQMAKKAPAKAKPAATKSHDTSHLKGTHVVNVRVGTYPDKTRIVLDLTAPATYSVDVDNTEKLLVLDVNGAKWSAKDSFTFKDSKLLNSFTAQNEGANSSRLLVALKTPVKVVKKFALKKDGPRKDRIVIDIAAE